MIIAADVLYEKEYALLVAECIRRALAPHGVAIVADPGRLALPDFRAHAAAIGLTIEDAERVPYEAGAVKQEVQVMRVRQANSR